MQQRLQPAEFTISDLVQEEVAADECKRVELLSLSGTEGMESEWQRQQIRERCWKKQDDARRRMGLLPIDA